MVNVARTTTGHRSTATMSGIPALSLASNPGRAAPREGHGVVDQGPIIEQATIRCVHRDAVDDLVRKGRDLEKQVLAAAVRWHLEDRVCVHDGKTVVFD